MEKSSAIKLMDKAYVIPGATNVGLIASGKTKKAWNLYLIDSGMNDEDAERIYNEICLLFPDEKGGFCLKAIINTHSHADHAGGNAFFQKKCGCKIYISSGEAGSIMNPWLQGAVFSGGNPLPELSGSYHQCKASIPDKILTKDSVIELCQNAKISFIDLKGHYFDMLGVKYTDRNGKTMLFTGDAFFGREHIMKYWIPYLYDVGKFKESLERLNSTNCNYYIPSHGTILNRIQETIELNTIAILSTEHSVLHILEKKAMSVEELVKEVADLNCIRMKNAQYFLITTTIKSYLTYLFHLGKIKYETVDNKMTWSIVK
ncbi:MAG: MBL fold metallo-hydrolase [Treponema sp.]|nr:MBL fold metallo-hydrolase [Treponema sp.]